MFSSRNFVVSGLTLNSLIYFEFIFVNSVRKQSSLILLHVVVQFSQNPLVKRLSFPHCISLPPLSQINCPYTNGFISGPSILFHLSNVSAFVPVSYSFDYCSFVVQFEIREHDTSSFVLLSQYRFGYLGSLVFPYKFQNYLFQFCEKCS